MNATFCPEVGLVGLEEIVTDRLPGGGGWLMTKGFVEVAVFDGEAESVVVRETWKVPGLGYECDAVAPEPEDPSPKFHVSAYGDVPPDGLAVNVTT